MTITDDGGQPAGPRNTQPGVGIPGMEARIQRLGGSFSFGVTPSGARVSASIPFAQPRTPSGYPRASPGGGGAQSIPGTG